MSRRGNGAGWRANGRHVAWAALSMGAALTGCAGGTGRDTQASGDPSVADALAATYAQDLEALAAEQGQATQPAGQTPASRSGVFVERSGRGIQNPEAAPASDGPAPVASTDGDAGADTQNAEGDPAPAADAGQDVQSLARDLGRALRARAITGATPYEDLSRVAMLEAIAPGVLEGLGETAEQDAPDLARVLAPSEREALRAARRTALSLASSGAADPSVAAEALRAAAESLEQSQVIRIASTALCRRVDGFARYEAFEGHTFLAGRTNPMIVYVEVDRFRQMPLEGQPTTAGVPAGARFSTRLTQSLNLYFSEGGLLVWRRAPQTVTDYAASRIRDFYIIDTIELPATLSAGSYSLKVVVKDEATGQQAEAIIPVTLVADPTLAQGG